MLTPSASSINVFSTFPILAKFNIVTIALRAFGLRISEELGDLAITKVCPREVKETSCSQGLARFERMIIRARLLA